jgi:hypothetical protein
LRGNGCAQSFAGGGVVVDDEDVQGRIHGRGVAASGA